MRAVTLSLLTGVVLATSACSGGAFWSRTAVEKALPYKASLREEKGGALSVSVRADGAGLDAVRESARYVVTRHCLEERGSSAADWVIDPATGDWAVTTDGRGTLSMQARCRA